MDKIITPMEKIINIVVETVENLPKNNKIGHSFPQITVDLGNKIFPGKYFYVEKDILNSKILKKIT